MSFDIEKLISFDLRNLATGSYSPFTLTIEVDGVTNEENTPTLFHEYTHYLQNFTTFQGLIRFEDYTTYFLTCFAKLGSSAVNPTIPLKDYSHFQEEMGNKNLYNLNNVRLKGLYRDKDLYMFEDHDGNDYDLVIEKMTNNYTDTFMEVPFLIMDGKKIPINELVIKENMALCNTIIASKNCDTLSMDEIQSILEFKHKEYNVIIDFVYNFIGVDNLLEITYKVCEMILNIIPITKSAFNILNYIKANHESLRKLDKKLVVESLYKAFNYRMYLTAQFEAYKKIVNDKIDLLTGIFKRDRNEFVQILIHFYKTIYSGILIRNDKISFYTTLFSNDYMKQFVKTIGCPIIYYTATKQVVMPVEVPSYFTADFAYLHATLKVFIESYESEIKHCPLNIGCLCKVTKNQNCITNCFDNYYADGYDNCLLTNALNCTGIRSQNRT